MTQMPADIPSITHDQLPDGAVLVDVREDSEWALGRAPRARHIPLGELTSRLDELPQERPIIVTCRSGGRSARAVAFLLDQGYDAINLTGGMLAWQEGARPMTHDGPGIPSVS